MEPSYIIMSMFTSTLLSQGEKDWTQIASLLLISVMIKYYKNIYDKIMLYFRKPINYIHIYSENTNAARNIVYSAVMWYIGDKIKSEVSYEQSSVNTDFSRFYSDDSSPYKKFPVYDIINAKEFTEDELTYFFDYEKIDKKDIQYTKYCVTIKCRDIEKIKQKIDIIIDKYKIYLKTQEQKKIVTNGFIVYTPHKGNSYLDNKIIWDYKIITMNKSFENLFIPDKIKTNIKTSIQRLNNDNNYYKKFAIPRKLTLLLHGNPGCGKTSLYLTIANEYKMPIYIVNNKEILENNIKDIPDNSIIVFEEIDTFGIKNRTHIDKDEKDKKDDSKECLRLILELLDGNYTLPEQSIVILTTNYLNRLDPAVFRKGRVDHLIELENPNKETIKNIFKYHYDEVLISEDELNYLNGKLPTCEYTNSILLNLDNQAEAIDNLIKLSIKT